MKLSIALATFNGGAYLGNQLESYLKQSRLPDELIVSDDHSSDETGEVVRRFAEAAPFPVVWRQNPGKAGVFCNFSHAVQSCCGDVILLSDQDDIWSERHIEVLAGYFQADAQMMAVCSNSDRIDGFGKHLGINTWKHIAGFSRRKAVGMADDSLRVLLSYRGVVSAHGMAIHRNVIQAAFPTENRFGRSIDTYLFYLAALMGNVAFHYDSLTYYRRHGNNASHFERFPLSKKIAANTGNEQLDSRLNKFVFALQMLEARNPAALELRSRKRIDQLMEYHKLRSQLRSNGLSGLYLMYKMACTRRYFRDGNGIKELVSDLLSIILQTWNRNP